MVTSKATLATSSETINRLCASKRQMTKLSNTSALVSRRLLRQVRASQLRTSQGCGSQVRGSQVRGSAVLGSQVRESQVRTSHLCKSKPRNSQCRPRKAGAGRVWSGEVARGGVVLIRCCDLDRREQQKFPPKR